MAGAAFEAVAGKTKPEIPLRAIATLIAC